VSALPDPETFLSGETGHVAGVRRTLLRGAGDRLLDLRALAARSGRRLDELAGRCPERRVRALCVYRPGNAERALTAARELPSSRHRVQLAFGATGEPHPALAAETVESGLRGGKFQNLNALLAAAGGASEDWTLVVDDDVALPRRFLDRLVGVCEAFDLALAQPAQTLASHAAWRVTRRRGGSLVRETRFVEIGPVTAFRHDAAEQLMPFPELRYGWGLDLHWAALAAERGWRLGIVDALPVRHAQAPVAAAYGHSDAIEEARRFLAGRPYVTSDDAQQTLAVHRRAPA
jgi:hypothetical protein